MPFPLAYRCHRVWDSFVGDGAIRHCSTCDRSVHDLDVLTPDARAALLGSPTPVCVRFVAVALLATASPAFADPPVVPGEGPLPEAPREVVIGALDRTVIEDAIRPILPALREAWERRPKAPAGKIVVRFTFGPDGVTDVSVAPSTTLADAALQQVVVDEVKRLAWVPPGGGRIVVTYPFVFQR